MITQTQNSESKSSLTEIVLEDELSRIKAKEKKDRLVAFFIPFVKASLLTAAILYIFNYIVV